MEIVAMEMKEIGRYDLQRPVDLMFESLKIGICLALYCEQI